MGGKGGRTFEGSEEEIGVRGEMTLGMEPSDMPSWGWLDMTSELEYRRS